MGLTDGAFVGLTVGLILGEAVGLVVGSTDVHAPHVAGQRTASPDEHGTVTPAQYALPSKDCAITL